MTIREFIRPIALCECCDAQTATLSIDVPQDDRPMLVCAACHEDMENQDGFVLAA